MSLPLQLTVNDAPVTVVAPPARTLLDLLRDDLGLTGAKRGCDDGECGACAVLLDGMPVTSCILLAHQAAGRSVRTVEGLDDDHPLPAALVAAGAVQCGFCLPGIVMTTLGTLAGGARPTEDQVRAALVGSLCRCTGYQKVVDGVLAWAARELPPPTNREDRHGSPP